MIQEFRDFLTKGNLIDIAVGFIMGAAFTALTVSFTEDVVMPIIAIPFGEPSFDSLTWTVNDSVIAYGSFLTTAMVFLLTALAVFFFIVKPINAYRTRQGTDDEDGPSEIELLTDIRDSLADR